MGNWFGSIDLAYKYTIVFGSLLILTICGGLIKVFFDRRKLKKLAKQADEEQSKREERVELTQREKDEGDLFGVRAIEAGFYAGIPQSRPTSRAGSPTGSPNMSSSTLVGGRNSPKYQSVAGSVTSLPLAHANGRSRDSETLPSPPRRVSPPTIRLRPSEAEMSGRINHNAAVNMGLEVPPSPILAQHANTSRYSGSDSGDSDRPEIYSPMPPHMPMSNNVRVSVTSAQNGHQSHAASINDGTRSPSPNASAPTSPRYTPEPRGPMKPERVYSNEALAVYTAYQKSENAIKPEPPSSPVLLLPAITYQSSHERETSGGSSVYSEKRKSVFRPQHERTMSSESGFSFNYSFPKDSPRNSVAPAASKEQRPGSTLAPGHQANDARFSEFYDAYFRQSQLNPLEKTVAPKRPPQINTTEATIVEVPSPLPSPMPSTVQPGAAL